MFCIEYPVGGVAARIAAAWRRREIALARMRFTYIRQNIFCRFVLKYINKNKNNILSFLLKLF